MKKFMVLFLLLGLAGLLTAADIEIVRQGPIGYSYAMPVKATADFDQGDSVCTDSTTGYALPCTDAASRIFWGFASKAADNTSGANGAIKVQTEGGIYLVVFDTVAVTNIGDVAYVKTDQSFAVSGTANAVIAGKVVKYVDATHAWIDTRTSVTTTASTITGTNVSLADSANHFTGTNAETVTAEIGALARGYVMIGNATGHMADVDANNDGYILAGDGTDTTSVEITAFLASDGDLARGYVWRGSATGLMEAFDANDTGKVLMGDGTDLTSALITDANINHAVANRTQEVDYCFWYDFATHGTTSPVTLTKCGGAVAQTLPDNFVVTSCYYEMHAAFTVSGASNISLGHTGTATSIAGTQDSAHAQYALGYVALDGTGIPYKVDGADNVILTASANTITGGTIYIYCRGHQGN